MHRQVPSCWSQISSELPLRSQSHSELNIRISHSYKIHCIVHYSNTDVFEKNYLIFLNDLFDVLDVFVMYFMQLNDVCIYLDDVFMFE